MSNKKNKEDSRAENAEENEEDTNSRGGSVTLPKYISIV